MDRYTRNPISLIGDLCLMAFLLPGHFEKFVNSDDGYQVVLGLLQPGWCEINVNPPQLSNVQAGMFFHVSMSWIFLGFFIISKIISYRHSGAGDSADLEEYRRSTRHPRY